MKGLTRRQQEVLDFIEHYVATHGFPPSVRDIAAHLSLLSASGVHKHIKALVRKKVLSKQEFTSRSLRVLKRGGGSLPAYADSTSWKGAGVLSESGVNPAHGRQPASIKLPTAWVGRASTGHVFLVDWTGLSTHGVQSGDSLLVSKETEAARSDLVLIRNGGKIELARSGESATSSAEQVYGVVIALWRPIRSTTSGGDGQP